MGLRPKGAPEAAPLVRRVVTLAKEINAEFEAINIAIDTVDNAVRSSALPVDDIWIRLNDDPDVDDPAQYWLGFYDGFLSIRSIDLDRGTPNNPIHLYKRLKNCSRELRKEAAYKLSALLTDVLEKAEREREELRAVRSELTDVVASVEGVDDGDDGDDKENA